MENKSFKKFLEAKSTGVKVERQGGRISWDEEIMKNKRSFTGFLEFAYSDKKSGEFIYLDRSTAFDVLERINWLENKMRSLSRKTKILSILFMVVSLIAVWGWLI
ncbi:MAG: hypothetical protein ACUVUS_05215 [Thermoproteota archaeon]